MPRPFLIGSRVQLRPMEESDAESYAEWINHPEMREYLLIRFPLSLKDEREFLGANTTRKGTPRDLPFAIELRETGDLIGAVGLHQIDWVHRRGVTGMFLGPAWRGRGYGTESKNLLLDYAFGELGLHSVWALVFETNEASIHALEKQGYRRSGIHRKALLLKGRWVDEYYYDLLRDEWREIRRNEEAGGGAVSKGGRKSGSGRKPVTRTGKKRGRRGTGAFACPRGKRLLS